jgi:hypothetical protein
MRMSSNSIQGKIIYCQKDLSGQFESLLSESAKHQKRDDNISEIPN